MSNMVLGQNLVRTYDGSFMKKKPEKWATKSIIHSDLQLDAFRLNWDERYAKVNVEWGLRSSGLYRSGVPVRSARSACWAPRRSDTTPQSHRFQWSVRPYSYRRVRLKGEINRSHLTPFKSLLRTKAMSGTNYRVSATWVLRFQNIIVLIL